MELDNNSILNIITGDEQKLELAKVKKEPVGNDDLNRVKKDLEEALSAIQSKVAEDYKMLVVATGLSVKNL